MSLSFPRKFIDGHRVDNADTYAEVTIYPSGHWVIGTHTNMAGGFHAGGTSVNYSFVLLGGDNLPLQGGGIDGLSRYGMPKDHEWSVAPSFTGGPDDRHDSISGELDPKELAKTESIAILITKANKATDIAGVARQIGTIIGGAVAVGGMYNYRATAQ